MNHLNVNLKASPSGRLSRADRRSQLLQVSREVLETDGAYALTLGMLAKRAGVSKPVAYDHFKTRAGLLLAMLEDTSRYYESDAKARLEMAPISLTETARILAEVYVACTLEAGPSVSVLIAAIEANVDTQIAGRRFRARHAEQLQLACEHLVSSDTDTLPLIYNGLIAAADAICAEMTGGRISPETASDAIAHLLTNSLLPFVRT